MNNSKGLGRGLNALFDDIEDVKEVTKTKTKEKELDKVVEIKISEIEPMLNQPRKIFDKDKLQELAGSIKQHGIIQPILVIKNDNGYSIVAGERRWRAAKLVGLESVPVIIKDYTDTKKKEVALIENIQREDLNIVEVAEALKELMTIEDYTVADVAKVTGKSTSGVSNTLRLLKLPTKVKEYMLEGKLFEGQARAILAIDNEEEQIRIAEKIIEKKLTVREVEKLIYDDTKYNVKKKATAKKQGAIYKAIEDRLTQYFGVKARIDNTRKKQKLVLEYLDNDGLQTILDKLKIEL